MAGLSNPFTEIKKVGIIGEGKMGTGIFNYLLDFPFELVWNCSRTADADKLTRQFSKKINRSLDAGIINEARFEQLQQTAITHDANALHNCDLLIEAVSESAGLKRDLFAHLDRIVKQDAIFASNSSSIKPTEMAPSGHRAGKFIGLHFFYPVPLKNIVELTFTCNTTDQTIELIEFFLDAIRRRFITLNEKNAFMLNRIFLDFQNEAFLLVHAGRCSYHQMDKLVKDHFFPFGVFDFCDSVGLDTMLASILNYTSDYPHKSHYFPLMNTLTGLVSVGSLGMKTQSGFYTYPLDRVTDDAPANSDDIIHHLQQTWLSSGKRHTAQARIPIDDANYAIKEYFDITKGPFE